MKRSGLSAKVNSELYLSLASQKVPPEEDTAHLWLFLLEYCCSFCLIWTISALRHSVKAATELKIRQKRCSSTWLLENFVFKAQFRADFLVALQKTELLSICFPDGAEVLLVGLCARTEGKSVFGVTQFWKVWVCTISSEHFFHHLLLSMKIALFLPSTHFLLGFVIYIAPRKCSCHDGSQIKIQPLM